jgi:hypothetical protein
MIINGKQIKNSSIQLSKFNTSNGQGLTFSDAPLFTLAGINAFSTYSYVSKYWVEDYFTNSNVLAGNGLQKIGRTVSILIDPASSGYISTGINGLKIEKLSTTEVYISTHSNIQNALSNGFVGQVYIQMGDVLILTGATGIGSGPKSYIYTSLTASTYSNYYIPLENGINNIDSTYIRNQFSATNSITYNNGVIGLQTDSSLINTGTLRVNSDYVGVTVSSLSASTLNAALTEISNRITTLSNGVMVVNTPNMSGFIATSSITQVGSTYSPSDGEPMIFLNGVKQSLGIYSTSAWFIGSSTVSVNINKTFTTINNKLFLNPIQLGYSVLEADGDVIEISYIQL